MGLQDAHLTDVQHCCVHCECKAAIIDLRPHDASPDRMVLLLRSRHCRLTAVQSLFKWSKIRNACFQLRVPRPIRNPRMFRRSIATTGLQRERLPRPTEPRKESARLQLQRARAAQLQHVAAQQSAVSSCLPWHNDAGCTVLMIP